MREVFELWHWALGAHSPDETVPEYDTADAAARSVGFASVADWRVSPDCRGYHHPAEWSVLVERWSINRKLVAGNDYERVQLALGLLLDYGQVDGDHHKMWVIDQTVRILAADDYAETIAQARDGGDGPGTYSWDEGIAP